MNLLLLLSALLSALTGVSGGVRTPTVAQAVSAREQATGQTLIAPRTISLRPVAVAATLSETAQPERIAMFALSATEPLFAARRRE